MSDLSTSIKKLYFDFPVFNASGILGATESEIKKVLESEAGAVVIKSVTLEKRPGNTGVRFYWDDIGSINSMGLPNQGIDYYCNLADKLTKYNKPVILSIAGFKEDDYKKIIAKADKVPFSAIEVNLSCPNIEGKGIFAYDYKTMFRLLKDLRKKSKKVLGVKLPPYTQREQIKGIAENFVKIGIDFITTMNTFPLSTYIDYQKETMRIKPNMGIGGLGGKAVKQIALAQVLLFKEYSNGKLPIIAVGGISSAADVYEFILIGATAVQIGTALLKNDTKIFVQIKKDLSTLLKEKKVKRLSDKIGNLKYL
ncbi:hypothetical protein A2954_06830 [Candidatus Roizmanbacteria bacterium RIFCSPLOWO2_01_FULL_37_12]|uniref:Dihydroorotate dehydrogenase catalytic domain-containing protein n=1 Tax=Candidatus Roizmanbacteria bacterium RIFCSPLOWO2_01_FULL_37_12 TaxID=1802056 RepID=A0A1F7ID71_9BACT|nr:MAG: hypothetical protein A3D76_05775 [Candidatus Roizmanbacteria bacterium RIFCSPHIGHO2_02_FULL_37_9b]OGK41305.1 MAG: hypothetical protein A2954_06830 [Candidatus Roizmanbacteria bacterium RIFCSPLOWO2_01_FULL_37_12]